MDYVAHRSPSHSTTLSRSFAVMLSFSADGGLRSVYDNDLFLFPPYGDDLFLPATRMGDVGIANAPSLDNELLGVESLGVLLQTSSFSK